MQPPVEAVAWIERTLGRDARVVICRRLTGGLTSHVHQVTISRRGRRASYVLRWWGERATYAPRAVADETAILTALAASDVPVPRLIAATTDVAHGGPAVLMTRVPGRVYLMPRDCEHWLAQMAHMLARIHALAVAAPPFEPWLDTGALAPPADATRPEIWRAAIALVREPAPAVPACFIHRDYQHFNLLWTRERLTGVVDWAGACTGPPALDVGHCRLNLALLFSVEVAERFRDTYEAAAGRTVHPWWDVHALLSYGPEWKQFLPLQIDRRAPLDPAGMASRVEDLLERALRRAS